MKLGGGDRVVCVCQEIGDEDTTGSRSVESGRGPCVFLDNPKPPSVWIQV